MIMDLQKHGASLARWLDDPAGRIFLQYVEELREISMSVLRKDMKVEELFRAQGEIKAYGKLLELKEECQKALKRGH